jgi:hypothetical protein
VNRQEDGDNPEPERADDSIAERLALLVTRQAENQHRQHQRVVGAEQPLEQHQQTDRNEISGLDVHLWQAGGLTRFVSRPIFGSTQG